MLINRYIPLLFVSFIAFGFNAQGAVIMEVEQVENEKGEPYLVENTDSPTPSYKVVRTAPDPMGAGQGGDFDEVEAVNSMVEFSDETYRNTSRALNIVAGVNIFMLVLIALIRYTNYQNYMGIPQ